MHKTGSSAIQAGLSEYDDGETFYAPLGRPNQSAALVTAVSAGYRDYHVWRKAGLTAAEIDTRRDQARADIAAALARRDRRRAIFSGEDVSSLPRAEFAALVAWLAEAGPVTLLVYLRDPADYAASALQQIIQGGARHLPRRVTQRMRGVLTAAKATGARLIVRDYRPDSFPQADVVADVCALLDLDRARCGTERPNTRMSATALRLLWQFNCGNPAFQGDPKLLRAHERLKHILRETFANAAPIPLEPFAGLADYDDIGWLRDTHGITYRDRSAGATAEDARRWLDEVPEDATKALAEVLARHDLRAPDGADPVWMLNRIYYLCLSEDHYDPKTRTLRTPRLGIDDLPALRSAALSHNEARPLDRGEARHLLDLALRIRPNGPVLLRTRAAWDRDKG
ncbi:hypothetical protein SAMN04515678_102183 [Roseivivax sediminis]|uniref:Uncharacterized protein n=2 Tax=Roseivivax sediminis TaxID=936889 RepID=A0A1I1U6S6_9RHOB|nr:hypothetical protein SAMN04515678_102183 [Roseivivax sediminis]